MDKIPEVTGLTPEAEIGEAAVLFKKKTNQQTIVKNLLKSQMTKKKE